MANQLAKDLELMFEEFVEGYDSACVMSMEADKTFPAPQAMQRAGDTFYVKQDYMVSVTTGLDISGATPTDLVERFVPITYRSPDNVLVTLDAKEMRDPDHKSKSGKAASLRLSAEIDKNIMTTVAARAGIAFVLRPLVIFLVDGRDGDFDVFGLQAVDGVAQRTRRACQLFGGQFVVVVRS